MLCIFHYRLCVPGEFQYRPAFLCVWYQRVQIGRYNFNLLYITRMDIEDNNPTDEKCQVKATNESSINYK